MKKLILMALMFAPLSLFAQKFGHVNSQEIIQAMPEYATAKTQIDALQKQYETDLKSQQDELTKKSDEYEKAKATLPDKIKPRWCRFFIRTVWTNCLPNSTRKV